MSAKGRSRGTSKKVAEERRRRRRKASQAAPNQAAPTHLCNDVFHNVHGHEQAHVKPVEQGEGEEGDDLEEMRKAAMDSV